MWFARARWCRGPKSADEATVSLGDREPAYVCHDFVIESPFHGVTFEEFAGSEGVRLRAALVAGFGAQAGMDAAAEAIAYG